MRNCSGKQVNHSVFAFLTDDAGANVDSKPRQRGRLCVWRHEKILDGEVVVWLRQHVHLPLHERLRQIRLILSVGHFVGRTGLFRLVSEDKNKLRLRTQAEQVEFDFAYRLRLNEMITWGPRHRQPPKCRPAKYQWTWGQPGLSGQTGKPWQLQDTQEEK